MPLTNTDQQRFTDTLDEAAAGLPCGLSEEQTEMMWRHFQIVLDANQRMNLTRITDPINAAISHYADSLATAAWAMERGFEPTTILDVGTGAGFPAVPLAIAEPGWTITAMDTTEKKAKFVAESAAVLGLDNIRAEHAHSEHWKAPAPFDVVVLRAVGQLPKAVQCGARFVARGGWLVVYKTAKMSEEELNEGNKAADANRLTSVATFDYGLPGADHSLQRVLKIYKKTGA